LIEYSTVEGGIGEGTSAQCSVVGGSGDNFVVFTVVVVRALQIDRGRGWLGAERELKVLGVSDEWKALLVCGSGFDVD